MTLKIRIKKSSRYILLIGFCTLLGFPLLAAGVFFFTGESWLVLFRGQLAVSLQLLIGIISGILFGFAASFTLQWRQLQPLLKKYRPVIQRLNLNTASILFLSFCAGFGEEIFFRGCLQIYLGIWITAIIFVAIHGYLNPLNWRLSIYGSVMVLASAGFGYLTEMAGVFSAAMAHMTVDVILFKKLTKL